MTDALITLLTFMILAEIEDEGICPMCESSLDSGFGFGKRDYECEECDFSISFSADLYLSYLELTK